MEEERSSNEAVPYLTTAFAAYCKKAKRLVLSEQETEILDYCAEMCIHPVLIQFLTCVDPLMGISGYSTCPADKMHTLLAGLFRDWIVYVCIIGTLK